MNTVLVLFCLTAVAVMVAAQDFGPCIGGFCPAGSTCNPSGICVSSGSDPSCVDIATNCGVNAALCTNTLYQPLMAQKCKRTCNLCNGASCTDVASSCPAAYCNNALYRDLMMQKCRRTCGFC